MIKLSVKLLVSFLFVLIFAVAGAAQLPCALTEVPRLHGLRLGMSPADVRSVFGSDLKIKVKSSGDRTFFQNYIKKSPPASLRGIVALYLRFLDGRLYEIEIFYEERADVPTLEVFTANLAAQLNFPESAWRFEKNKAVIDCGAFTIFADKPLNPRVELTDTALQKAAAARRKKKSE